MLNTREAKTQADVTPAEQPVKPAEMLFCIRHEQMVKAELGVCGLGHAVIEGQGDDVMLDFCCFPDGYAFSALPEDRPVNYDKLEENFFDGDWAAQEEPDDWCADEVGAWED